MYIHVHMYTLTHSECRKVSSFQKVSSTGFNGIGTYVVIT